MKDIGCSKPTAIIIRKELEAYDLWYIIDQGKNRPTKIFINEIILFSTLILSKGLNAVAHFKSLPARCK